MVTSNARLSDRAPFFAEVDVLSLDQEQPRRVWGTDVSEGGMFLQTTHGFRVGEKLSLRFDVPVQRDDGTEDHEVHIRAAEVRWVRPFEPIAVDGKLPGIGLKFLALDPPARAALRRFSRPDMKEDITVPERAAASIPSLPPAGTSLPPITGSIAKLATTTPIEITEEMLAVSLPPFSTPPKKKSLPPDEALDEQFVRDALQQLRSRPPQTAPKKAPSPRDVTMGPKSITQSMLSMPPQVHPLAGWSFQRVISEDEDTKREIPSLPPPSMPPVLAAPDGTKSIGDGLPFDSFVDGPPVRMGLPSVIVEPSIMSMSIASDPPGVHISRVPELAHLASRSSHAPSQASLVPQASDEPYSASFDTRLDRIDEAFARGEVAVTDLPRATPRKAKRTARKHSPSRALAFACALIVGGSFVGVGLGLAGKRAYLKGRAAPIVPAVLTDASSGVDKTAPAPVAPAAPPNDMRLVAELEKAVPVRPMPDATTAPARKPALVDPENIRAASAAKSAPLPRKPSAKADGKASAKGGFRLDIPVGEATVARAFTLVSPARVVVDLEGGTTPKEPLDGDGTTTKRVRFGHPRAGTSRVVVELADGVSPTDLQAKVSGGRLALTFK